MKGKKRKKKPASPSMRRSPAQFMLQQVLSERRRDPASWRPGALWGMIEACKRLRLISPQEAMDWWARAKTIKERSR